MGMCNYCVHLQITHYLIIHYSLPILKFMNIKCLIVDDEPLASELVATHLAKIPELELVGSCHNAYEAMAVLQKEKIDLLFLDIQMPRMTGWELLKNITHKPYVIITTAYREHALEGYEFDVLDFLCAAIQRL